MNRNKIHCLPGTNYFHQPLGNFHVQIQRDGLDGPEAKITASILPPPDLTERQRSSGAPSTVELSIPVHQAMELAVHILRRAKVEGLPLPEEVSLR